MTIDGTERLDSVSCVSVSFCMAVDGGGHALTYDGSSWSAPTTIDGTSPLESVSCASESFCATIDDVADALTYDGSTWSAPTSIDPGFIRVADIGADDSMSCPSTAFCAAVDAAGHAFTYNGSTWSAPANIPGFPNAVSCPSTSFCLALDGFGSHEYTFNGGTWSDPATFNSEAPASVSCASPSFCVAVTDSGYALTYGEPVGPEPEPERPTNPEPKSVSTLKPNSEIKPKAPVIGQRETVTITSGIVTIRAKGTSTFVPLSGSTSIPDGSEVEATNGRVVITAVTPTGKTVTAEVYGGRFRVHQDSSGETHFILTLPLTGCPRVALPRGAAALASRAKHSSGPKSRHLWVSEGGGSWGTNGRFVSTSVEGTTWLTLDECTKSEVKVTAGKVQVRDLVRKRIRTVTAGHSDVALAKHVRHA